MHVLLLTLFLWTPVNPEQVIVLKNGKVIVCREYKVAGGLVTLQTGDQTFSIPEKLVSWERSKAETARRADQQKRAAKVVKTEKPDFEAKAPPKKPIVLTKENYKRSAKTAVSGQTTISYRNMGNTILVDASINGSGPHTFVLDTGAAVTLISPEAARQLGVAIEEEGVQLVGIGGQAVNARYCVLDEVALGKSKVQGLRAVIRGIPQLNSAEIVGLLGQDYFNHFIMSLNSANRTLTLTPHGAGELNTGRQKQYDDVLRDPTAPFRELNAVNRKLEAYYREYMRTTPSNGNDTVRGVKGVINDLPRIRGRIDQLYLALRDLPAEGLSPADKQNVQAFVSCYPRFGKLLTEVQQFSQLLRKAYSNTSGEAAITRMRGSLQDGWSQVIGAVRDFRGCQ